ncbi:MAG: Fe-S cluster assembly protein SufD [Gammaproteobacteria bacterium]|nr:Fe-S cluster assembly protein SufD [Gammaproteobacteria bacterium]
MIDITEHYTQQYHSLAENLPGNGVEWIKTYRNNRLSRFQEAGFPTTRDEDWRYTTVRPITNKKFTSIGDIQVDRYALISSKVAEHSVMDFDSYQLVFVDGVLMTDFSELTALGDGVQINSIADVLRQRPESIQTYFDIDHAEESNGFTELNRAFSKDGAVIELQAGVCLEKPLELLFLSFGDEALAQSRNLIVAHEGSKATIIERYVSAETGYSLTNNLSEVVLDKKSEIDYYLVQTQSRDAYQVSGIWVTQASDSRFSCRTITLGGILVRNEIKIRMLGEGAHCDMFGLYSLSGKQHVDNHTTVVHGAPNCTSNELYKGVLNQRSRGVFHGRIKVEQDAQKTDAKQSNNTLLLSRDAEIDTKPQLEIYADDVKCSHGATIGQMDEVSLFYLRSRGIDESDARSLLTFAFVNDVLREVGIDSLKESLESILSSQLISDRQTV